MTSKYVVYPVYGKDKGRFVLGLSKNLANKHYCHGEVLREAFLNCSTHNFIIIDWKKYQIKYRISGYESKWQQFRSGEFWNHFRFTTPCEDLEIEAYGHIR